MIAFPGSPFRFSAAPAFLGLAALAALGLGAAGCGGERGAAAAGAACEPAPGDFARRWLLTGEVTTRDPLIVTVPQAPIWPLTVRFLIEDGHRVGAGEKIAEFDGSQLLTGLDGLETRVGAAVGDLEGAASRAKAELADLALERAQKLAARDRAAVAARLPAELVPARERAEKALALERAELELRNAEAKLERTRETQQSQIAMKQLELDQARAELAELRAHLDKLTVKAPEAGIFFGGDHPREPRPIKAGDDLWSGYQLGRIPSAAGWQIEARLLDVDDGKIGAGQAVVAHLDGDLAGGGPGRPLHGRVRRIDQVAQEISRDSPRRAFAVIVDIDEFALGHPDGLAGRLRPGMAARVEVIEPPRRVAVLPRRCLPGWPAESIVACSARDCEVRAAAAGVPAASGAPP